MSMEYSDRISAVKPSAIREILKSTSQPGVISFAAGNPASDSFNVPVIKKIVDEIFETDAIAALQYSITEGLPELREELLRMVKRKYNIGKEFDRLVVISGGQQGIELATKVLVNEGETVICEQPTFVAALNSFRTFNANIVGVEMEEDGISVAGLEEALIKNPNTKLIYLIPNFQNPTGRTLSAKKRKAIYELAIKYNTRILEDNPYGDLRFRGENIPSIKSLDEKGIVIYLGSFSKVFSSGMRVGYMLAEEGVVSKAVVAKQCGDVHTNILAQKICLKFITEYDFDGYIQSLRELYCRKCDIMLNELKKYFQNKIKFTTPEGGLFIWCTLPNEIDCAEFCRYVAEEHKVAVVPGTAFNVDTNATSQSFRLNYSTPSELEIIEGIKRLAQGYESISQR